MTIVKHAFIICLDIRVSAHHAWVEKQNLSEYILKRQRTASTTSSKPF